jgi:hypothetical protein
MVSSSEAGCVGDHTSYNFSVCEELLKPLGTLGFPLALMKKENEPLTVKNLRMQQWTIRRKPLI